MAPNIAPSNDINGIDDTNKTEHGHDCHKPLFWNSKHLTSPGPGEKGELGASCTNFKEIDSFSFCGRAVVATFDLSAANLKEFREDHWLSNRGNVILLWLDSPAFLRDRDLSEVECRTPSRPAVKRRWVASPLQSTDNLPVRVLTYDRAQA